MKKLIILTLALVSVGMYAKENTPVRLSGYLGGNWNSEIKDAPYNLGADYWWKFSKSLSLAAGFTFYSGYGDNYEWTQDGTIYNWNDCDDYLFTLNISPRYDQNIKGFKKSSIGIFIQPSIMIDPSTHVHTSENQEGKVINAYTAGPKVYYQAQVGISYTLLRYENSTLRYDLSYLVSNLDFYEAYRKIKVGNAYIEEFLPKYKLLQGVRLSIYLEF